jgi:hypothetical protein
MDALAVEKVPGTSEIQEACEADLLARRSFMLPVS